jgi:hypothetical protein
VLGQQGAQPWGIEERQDLWGDQPVVQDPAGSGVFRKVSAQIGVRWRTQGACESFASNVGEGSGDALLEVADATGLVMGRHD